MGRPQGTPLREDGIYKIRRTIYYLSFIITISYKVKALPILVVVYFEIQAADRLR